MKAITLLIVCILVSLQTSAEIKNGYEKELTKAVLALNNFELLIAQLDGNEAMPISVKTKYLALKTQVKRLGDQFSVTRDLINAFKIIHPNLYEEINGIRNHHGIETDVYISVEPEEQMNEVYWGTTNLNQTGQDPHTYQSAHGPNSVSVKVRDCARSKGLRLLVHELGHVKYQVPNLFSYVQYYEEMYEHARQDDSYGHADSDPSNLSVQAELETFNDLYSERKHLLKNKKSNRADSGPLALLSK